MVLSTIVLVCITVWYHYYVPGYEILEDTLHFGSLYLVGIIATLLSLYFDNIFPCCCNCWKGESQYVQFNPNFSDMIKESGNYEMHVYDTIKMNWEMQARSAEVFSTEDDRTLNAGTLYSQDNL